MTKRPGKKDHTHKNLAARTAYKGFINAHGQSYFEGGTVDHGGMVQSTDDTAHGTERENDEALSSDKIIPKAKKPYQSKRRWLEKHFKTFILWLAGIVATAIVGVVVETIWSMNRELGVLNTQLVDTKDGLNTQLTDMKNKYDNIFNTSDNNKIDIITVSAEIRGDIKNLQDRVNKIENKVFP